jgi:hypothetical protein
MTAKALVDSFVGTVSSGQYTPTVFNTVNCSVSAPSNCMQYIRVGNVVTVSGIVDVNVTSNSIQTAFELSLPFATTLPNFRAIAGAGVWYAVQLANLNTAAVCWGSSNRAYFDFRAIAASNQSMSVTFTYVIA